MFGISKSDLKAALIAVIAVAIAKKIPFTSKYL
jgi:hypothetical protein